MSIDADEVARLGGTISYEVLAGIMARVPRLYIRDGRIVAPCMTSLATARHPRRVLSLECILASRVGEPG